MKRQLSYSLLLAMLLVIACNKKETETHGAFTCPMHPTVQSASPGLCPVCHMDLVAVSGLASNLPLGEEARLLEPVDRSIRSWASTVRPLTGRKSAPIETQATVALAEQMVVSVSSRVQGRLEKVFARIPNERIRKGETLATLYSPELVEAQAQHLLQNSSASRRVLEQLGFTEELFHKLETSRSPMRNVPIISPINGFLQSWSQTSSAANASSDADGMADGETTSPAGNQPAPGTAVSAGQELFRIFPANAISFEIQVPANSIPYLAAGDSILIEPEGKEKFRTVLQQFNKTEVITTFVSVRANAANAGLPIGTRVRAIIYPRPTEGIWVPSSSVVHLGERKIVFIRDGDFFRPRTVETGLQSGQMIQIISGITSADEVARQAGTLVDSDALLTNIEHDEK